MANEDLGSETLAAPTSVGALTQPAIITRYVAGFMFSPGLDKVALIRKSKPEWQRGKLNGIGGHIESGETIVEAMVREFQEETGRKTASPDWRQYADLEGPEFSVYFFAGVDDLYPLHGPNDEPIEILSVDRIRAGYPRMIENLPWLIALAVDHLSDGRPSFAKITYPEPGSEARAMTGNCADEATKKTA